MTVSNASVMINDKVAVTGNLSVNNGALYTADGLLTDFPKGVAEVAEANGLNELVSCLLLQQARFSWLRSLRRLSMLGWICQARL